MKMERTSQISKLIEIIRTVDITGKTYEEYVGEVAEALADGGVIAFPFKIGQEVFAVLPSVFGDPPYYEPWNICGVGVDKDGDFFAESHDHEQFVIGDLCMLDEAEAKALLEKYEAAYKKKGGERDEREET